MGSCKSDCEANDGRPVDGGLYDPQGQDDGQHAQDDRAWILHLAQVPGWTEGE